MDQHASINARLNNQKLQLSPPTATQDHATMIERRESGCKKQVKHLFDLPIEVTDLIFAYLPKDLHITPRRAPHDIPVWYANGTQSPPVAPLVIGLRTNGWHPLVELTRVSRAFKDMVTRAIETAINSRKVQLFMNTSDYRQAPAALPSLDRIRHRSVVERVQEEGNRVPDAVLGLFLTMKVTSLFAFKINMQAPTIAISKVLEVVIERHPEDRQLRAISTTWTASVRILEDDYLTRPHLEWENELFFAPGFEAIARGILTKCRRSLDALLCASEGLSFAGGQLSSTREEHFNTKKITEYHQHIISELGHGRHLGGGAMQLAVVRGVKADEMFRMSLDYRYQLSKRNGWRGKGRDAESLRCMLLNGGNGVSFRTKWLLVIAQMMKKLHKEAPVDGATDEVDEEVV